MLTERLFKASIPKSDLWAAYLANKGPEAICTTCREFVYKYGSLVTIDGNGFTKSALWDNNNPTIQYLVEHSGASLVPFLPTTEILGTPQTGEHTHLHVQVDPSLIYVPYKTMGPKSRADQILTHYKLLRDGLNQVTRAELEAVLNVWTYGKNDPSGVNSLHRHDRVLKQLDWTTARYNEFLAGEDNLLLLAVTQAPKGYFNPLSRQFGWLLRQIKGHQREFGEVYTRDLHDRWNQHVKAYPTAKGLDIQVNEAGTVVGQPQG